MNVRQKLSLAAMCIALPVLASAQAAAPAAAEAPAFEIKPYGFLLLTYNQNDGVFAYPEYPSKISAENVKTNVVSVRQSRLGFMMKNADGGFTGAKLGAKLEFDFMGAITGLTDSVPVRLRYAVATAEWAAGPGKLTAQVGQTDGLVNALHPELGAYIALPTFMQAGNLTRRSPQIRLGYAFSVPMVDLSVEAAVLQAMDAAADNTGTAFGTIESSAGADSGTPDIEARVQAVVKPMADVKATVAVGYHTNKRTYEANTAGEKDITASLFGVELNVDATKYLNVRGEFFKGSASDDSQGGAFAATTGTGAARAANDTSGFWAQATIKPIPEIWLIAGYGSTTLDAATDLTRTMTNLGVISPVSKNWRLGLEYTMSTYDNGTTDISGSAIALSSRFSF